MFIVAFDTNGTLIFVKRLTRKQYYHKSKINYHNKRVLKWNESLHDLHASLSEYHFKTSDPEEYLQSVENYATHYNTIWRRMGGSRKWSRGKFYLYQKKKKTIDDFLHSLKIKYTNTSKSKKGKKKHKMQGCKNYKFKHYVMYMVLVNFHLGPRVSGMSL